MFNRVKNFSKATKFLIVFFISLFILPLLTVTGFGLYEKLIQVGYIKKVEVVQRDALYAILTASNVNLKIEDLYLDCTSEKLNFGGCDYDDIYIDHKLSSSEEACKQLLFDKEGIRTAMKAPFTIKIPVKEILHVDNELRKIGYQAEELYQQCIAASEIAIENEAFASIEGEITNKSGLDIRNPDGKDSNLRGVYLKSELYKNTDGSYLMKTLASSNLDEEVRDADNLSKVRYFKHDENSEKLASYTALAAKMTSEGLQGYSFTDAFYNCDRAKMDLFGCGNIYAEFKFAPRDYEQACNDLLVNQAYSARDQMSLPSAFKIPYHNIEINDNKKRRYASAEELFLKCKSAYEAAKSVDPSLQNSDQDTVASVSGYLLDSEYDNTVMKIYLTKENDLPYLYIRYTPEK